MHQNDTSDVIPDKYSEAITMTNAIDRHCTLNPKAVDSLQPDGAATATTRLAKSSKRSWRVSMLAVANYFFVAPRILVPGGTGLSGAEPSDASPFKATFRRRVADGAAERRSDYAADGPPTDGSASGR